MIQKFLRSRKSDRLFIHKAVSTGLWRLKCFGNCFKGKKEGITKTRFSKDLFHVSVNCLARDGETTQKWLLSYQKNRKPDSDRKLKKMTEIINLCTEADSASKKSILRAFAKLRKATASFLMSVCPSFRIEHLGPHWKNFHKLLYLSIFRLLSRKFKFH